LAINALPVVSTSYVVDFQKWLRSISPMKPLLRHHLPLEKNPPTLRFWV